MLASYHNHTTWSDGKGSVAEMVAAAARLGLGELGISDHLTWRPDRSFPKWSMDPLALDAYLGELVAAARDAPVTLRAGIEADWFDGRADMLRGALSRPELDFVVGSVHEIGDMILDGSPGVWERLSPDEVNEVYRRYWGLIASMAESGLYDIAAHLDLPKKFGFHATADLGREIAAALDAIAEAGMIVELNTAGWHKPCRDAYPTLEILRACRARGIGATISADAHDPAHLLRDFDHAARRLHEAGYDRIARFAAREVRFEPLTP